jgi:uncharacterized damage-inducible protein DinB
MSGCRWIRSLKSASWIRTRMDDARTRSMPQRLCAVRDRRPLKSVAVLAQRNGVNMSQDQHLLEALLDSWDRNNTILVNLLRALPAGGLESRAMEGSPSVAEMFTHIHYVRLVFVSEDAPEFAKTLPEKEWRSERDPDRIAEMLNDSAKVVRDAVKGRLEAGQEMNLHFDHPILLLQHMIWHEGYHHGQIKLALKLAGRPVTNQQAGPVTWRVWMDKK